MSYGTVNKPATGREDSGPEAQSSQSAVDPPSSSSPHLDENHGNKILTTRETIVHNVKSFYNKNIGLFLVFLAQLFGSMMLTTTRLLETGFDVKFHALQVIFVRMFATTLFGSLYMGFNKIPGFPLGPRGVRRLLVIRGTAGTFGLIGLYYSLSYLELSDATVITFLVPTLTALVCWVALNEPFTIKEAMAGFVAFIGVLFIARPPFLFPGHNPENQSAAGYSILDVEKRDGSILPPSKSTPTERNIAMALSIFGQFCAATAYSTIRVIGKRAHSLVSVNYFSTLATVTSFLIIMIHPDLQFQIPQSLAQWILLFFIGTSGFLMQFLLTEGLQREKAGRATNLIYLQLVFVLIIERVIWGTSPPATSLIGAALIISGSIWVSLQKAKTSAPKPEHTANEEESLLGPENEARRT